MSRFRMTPALPAALLLALLAACRKEVPTPPVPPAEPTPRTLQAQPAADTHLHL